MYYMYTDEELRSLCRQNIESLEMWARRIIHDQFTQKYGTGDITNIFSYVRALGEGLESYEVLVITDKEITL